MFFWILVLVVVPVLSIGAVYYLLVGTLGFLFHAIGFLFHAILAIFEFISEHIVFFLVAGTLVFLWMKCF